VHIPPGTAIGRIRVASPTGRLVDHGDGAAVFGRADDNRWRQCDVSSGKREIVTWRDATEVDPRIIRAG
jgi:hypothetical protein